MYERTYKPSDKLYTLLCQSQCNMGSMFNMSYIARTRQGSVEKKLYKVESKIGTCSGRVITPL